MKVNNVRPWLLVAYIDVLVNYDNSFDKLYILDLHGSTKKHEVTPDGEKDENVFDIQQGVSINIFVKEKRHTKGSMGTVYHADLYGSREGKYRWLNNNDIEDVKWKTIDYTDPYYFFVERDESNRASWEKGISIKDIMPYNSTGILTARDALVVDMHKEKLLKRIQSFVDPSKTDDEIRTMFYGNKKAGKYLPGDTRGWSLSCARANIRNFKHEEIIRKVTYRPFDDRYIYYCPEMVDWGRFALMNMLGRQDNIALVVTRQAITDDWANAFLSKEIVDDSMVSNRTKERGYVFPLYLDNGFPNISSDFLNTITGTTGLSFSKRSSETTFDAMKVFDYIYAILFSNKYRSMYKDQLKADFPHIPVPRDRCEFLGLAALGEKLRYIHLLLAPSDYKFEQNYCGPDSCEVKNVKYENNQISIGKASTFGQVSEADWNFYIGGYQPLQKWLKDRKGMILCTEELHHYADIIGAVKKTQSIMAEIDSLFEQ